MPKKVKRNLFLYLWGMSGILFAIMISFMEAGNGWNVDKFLNQEQTCEISQNDLSVEENTCVKVADTEIYRVTAEKTTLRVEDLYQSGNWKYMAINISNLNKEKTYWNIVFCDKYGTDISKQTVTLVEGDNMIEVACRQPYQKIKLVIKEQVGLYFEINSIQFRMNDVVISPQAVMTNFFFWLGIYLGVSGIIYLSRKSKLYVVVVILQEGYLLVGDFIGKPFAGKKWKGYRRRFRTGIFFLMFTLGELAGIQGWYSDATGYKYVMLVMALCIILLGILCWERELKVLNWNAIIPFAWLLLWGSVCISDVMQSKSCKFVGYLFLTAVGFFFFLWNNMKNPYQVKREMYQAFNLNFVVVILYCMFFRTKEIGVLYNGPFTSRETFAIYAVTAVGAFLTQLYKELFRKNEERKQRVHMILYIVGIALGMSFLYYANTISCNLALMAEIIIFGYNIFRSRTILYPNVKKMICTSLIGLFAGAICVEGVNLAINFLPEALGTEIVYDEEELVTKQELSVLENLRMENPEYYNNVSYAGERNKIQIWKAYLQEINLFGHANSLTVNQTKTYAYSGWIEMIYRYGLFILIPYLLLFATCFVRAWNEKKGMLSVMVAYLIIMCFQNIEIPFIHPLWILCYLGMGEWFHGSRQQGDL